MNYDPDDTIRSTEGAYLLLAAMFEVAFRDASDPGHRDEALDWLHETGERWAVTYGGADPQVYRARLDAIEPGPRIYIPIDERHFVGELCKRGHEYQQTGGSLRRRHRASHFCVQCCREKNARASRKARAAMRQMEVAV